MHTEQILYTSCRRGIEDKESGLQIFSYSPRIADWQTKNRIGVLFAHFNGQSMPSGLPMLPTEEECRSLFPKRYTYRRLEGKDALCGMSLCTYIGKDYHQDSSRSGNFLGHAFVFHESECFINPGQLIGSESFVSKIDPALVRKDERPALLSVLELNPSDAACLKAIQEFLSEGDRPMLFKQMLACLLMGKDEQNKCVKRVFINDKSENICSWIRALMMVFPVNIALGMSFSSYEFDPEGSFSRIVGVSKGTAYSVSKHAKSLDYYFDFVDNVIDDSECDELSDFCDFVCDAMMRSYENLQAFHRFLGQFSYCEADTRLKDAYNLNLLSLEILSFEDFSPLHVNDSLLFALKYADENFNRKLSKTVLAHLHNADIDDDLFEVLATYLDSLQEAKILSKSSIIREYMEICAEYFCNPEFEYSDFKKLYSRFDNKTAGGSRKQFLARIEEVDVQAWYKTGCVWKPAFIIWLYAIDLESSQRLLDKDSYQYHILEILLHLLADDETNKSAATIEYLFAAYKKAGVDAITTLYVAVCLTSSARERKIDIDEWKRRFRAELSSLTKADSVRSIQILYENGMEDDIAYLLDSVSKGAGSDFIDFVKLLKRQLPDYFFNHKHYLMGICSQSARNLADHYRILSFSVDERILDGSDLEQMLIQVSREIALVKTPESQKGCIHGICNYCKKRGIAIPQRAALAAFYFQLQDLCMTFSKLFSSNKKLLKSIEELKHILPLRINELDNTTKREYLTEIAKYASQIMLKSSRFALQEELFFLDSETQLFFDCEILKNGCTIAKGAQDYESLLCLIIYDSCPGRNISKYIPEILHKNGISPVALKKHMNKGSTMVNLSKYYDSLDKKPKLAFDDYIDGLIKSMKPPQNNSTDNSTKNRIFGFFKNKVDK